MGTNIEQIFRSFVVSKFKEIQEEKLNSCRSQRAHTCQSQDPCKCDQAGSLLNGENVAPVMEASSSAIVVCDEGVLDEKTVEKTEEVLLEGLDVEPQKSDVKETPAESSSTVPEMNLVEEVPRKKSKKHKKHKSKKKKKKKKKEEKNRSHSKSKSNSSFQGQGEIDSESVPLQRGDSESLLKNLEDNKTNVVSLDTQSMADLENSKLSVQEQNLSVVTSVDGSKEAPFEVTQPEDECHTNINLMDINTTVEGLLLAPEPESDLIPAASVVSISKEEPEKSLEIAVKCEDECSIQASITDNGTADEKDSDKNQEVDINTLKRSRSRSASTSRKQPKLSSSHDTSNHSQSTRSGSRSGSLSDSKRSPSPSCRKSRSRSAEKGKNVEYSPKSRTKCSGSTSDKDKAKTHSRSHRSRSKSVARIKRSRSKTANRSKSRSLSHSRHEQRTRSRSKSKGRRSCSRERRRRSPSRERRKKSPSRERRKKSPSRERRKKSPSRERRKKSPSRERRKRSPSRERRRRSPSRERRRRSPLRERRRRSPSRERRKRSPSRERRKMSPSRERRRQSPSSERRKQSPRNSSSDKRRQRSNSKDCNSTGVKLRSRSRTPDYRQRSKSAGRRWSSCRSPGRQRKSRSPVKKKSFSRSPERRKRSRSPDKLKDLSRSPKRLTELDKAQLLEIAKANAAAMCVKAGVPLPESLKPTVAPAPAPVEEKVSHRSGAVTIQELTEKCKQIAQSKDDEIVNKPHVSDDEEEEEHLFINHPFKVNEPKSISFSLSNPTIKPAPKNQVTLTKEFPVSSGSQHRKKEVDAVYGEWVPVEKSSEESKDDVFTTTLPPPSVDISAAMTKRAAAQKRLTGNPFDMVALCLLNRAQEQIDAWAQSSSLPGQFTGSTGAQVLSSEELTNSGPQAWIRKDQFLKAAPVTGGMGAQLMRKMGWKEGEGLGRNNEGTVEPILIDFKRDRKGLVAEGEKTQKKSGNLTVMKDLSGKHPISALMEICNKRKWSPPEFVLVHDRGPDHRRHFLFKVMVNGSEYQPSLASPNKKLARATTATVALQAMGLVPRDNIANATSFMSASDS